MPFGTVYLLKTNIHELCNHPVDWKWSSACAHLKGEDDELVCVKPVLDRIDNCDAYLSDTNKV